MLPGWRKHPKYVLLLCWTKERIRYHEREVLPLVNVLSILSPHHYTPTRATVSRVLLVPCFTGSFTAKEPAWTIELALEGRVSKQKDRSPASFGNRVQLGGLQE